MLEERVFGFSPDIVIATHYHRNRCDDRAFILQGDRGATCTVPYEPLQGDPARDGGLDRVDRGGMPVPFASVRVALARPGRARIRGCPPASPKRGRAGLPTTCWRGRSSGSPRSRTVARRRAARARR